MAFYSAHRNQALSLVLTCLWVAQIALFVNEGIGLGTPLLWLLSSLILASMIYSLHCARGVLTQIYRWGFAAFLGLAVAACLLQPLGPPTCCPIDVLELLWLNVVLSWPFIPARILVEKFRASTPEPESLPQSA